MKHFKKDQKKFSDILTRFRSEVIEFTEKVGGVSSKKNNNKHTITRKEKRKLERKLKHAKNLAFSKKEKLPTLESLIEAKSKSKKVKPKENVEEKKPKPEVESNKNVVQDKKSVNSIQIVENQIMKESKEKKKYQESTKDNLKRKLIEDNKRDEKEIAKLEKKLHIKKDSNKYKKAFYDEGFADLLDFCDEDKRKEMLKQEENMWFGMDAEDEKSNKKLTETKQKSKDEDDSNNSDQSDQDDDDEDESLSGEDEEKTDGDFFIKPTKKSKPNDSNEDDEEFSDENSENMSSDESDEQEESDLDDLEDEDEEEDEDESEKSSDSEEINQKNGNETEKIKKGLKEDIYGRLIDKKGNIVQTEKYVPPAQRLKNLLDKSNDEKAVKLSKLSKQLNGLLNRLSTSNIISILNQIVQMFYSNQFTRYDLMQTLYTLIDNSLIKQASLTPIRLIIEHAALISALTSSVGIELGANLLQKLCQKLNNDLKEDLFYNIENKSNDNLLLFLCNLYNFKLFSSNLILDILNEHLTENIKYNDKNDLIKVEKSVDLILLILRSVGFSLRRDNPVMLKDLILKVQVKINEINTKFQSIDSANTELVHNRLKFMLESINAIKNNDIRKLDAFDQAPIDQIKKQMRNNFKEDQILLNLSYKDLLNANELGRWWIVGSAWNLKENKSDLNDESTIIVNKTENSEQSTDAAYSEKILRLAKEQRMNTDIRKAIFCILLTADDYTDAFIKLVKLSLKKQQEREIIYVILHCALNEKKYNPYYSFLLQKFCEYDRRFKMTLQFHTWDKFKLFPTMSKQQITNFSGIYTHLIGTGAMTLSVLKNAEFGQMNKSMVQFLKELFTNILTLNNDERIQEIFLKITNIKKLFQLRNAIKLFIYHFMLTDKGKDIVIDDKLKEKCLLAEKILNVNSSD